MDILISINLKKVNDFYWKKLVWERIGIRECLQIRFIPLNGYCVSELVILLRRCEWGKIRFFFIKTLFSASLYILKVLGIVEIMFNCVATEKNMFRVFWDKWNASPSRNQSNKFTRFFWSHFPLYSEKVLLCGLILNLNLKSIFLPTFFLNEVFL